MKVQEDFEFSSELSVQEALERLKRHVAESKYGGFYGSVEGNQFALFHAVGSGSQSDGDPKLSGYIKIEGKGCRVFARTRVAAATEWNLRFGMSLFVGFIVLILVTLFTFGKANETRDTWLTLIAEVVSIAFTGFGGLYYWRKFKNEGQHQTVWKIKNLLKAVKDEEVGIDKKEK